jgi:hypothetical protein
MTEDQPVEENVQATPPDERESDQASEDLESLFEDDSQKDEDAPVTRKELERLEKGIQKLATNMGRQKVEETKGVAKEEPQSVMKSLYFKANPEAQEIWDEVTNEATKLGRDPFELYEGSAYFKGEAKARAEAKAEEEKSKSKVNKPSSDVDFSKNIGSIKEEDIDKLTPKQKIEWVKVQANKERDSTD